jgi:hypothetical protein
MADDGKEAPAQPKKDKGSLSRTVLPYIVAAALASAVMAWYFFIFVPGKLDYFVGLKFRTLAVAGGHVGSKIQSLERAIRSVPGMTDSTCSARVVDPKQPTVASRYVALVLPEIRLQGTGAGASGLLLTCGISGTVAWSDIAAVAAAASRRDFDDLVLADESGNVVWQREATTPRVGNVTELLGATDDAGGWLSLSWRERATLHVQQDKKYLRSTAVLKTLNLAGRPSLFFVQAVTITSEDLPAAKDHAGAPATRTLYVGGLASREALQRQAMRVPAAWLVFFALPLMLLFLSIPFVKLRTLMPRERYRYADLVALILATIAAAGLGAIVPFVRAPISAGDRSLDEFHGQIERRLESETKDVLALANRILKQPATIGQRTDCDVAGSGVTMGPGRGDGKAECGLWQALFESRPSIELDVVIWFNDQGQQVRKWTTKAQITGPASHRPFGHFRDVSAGRLWTLRNDDSSRPFTIEPLRAPTTSELGVMFAMPAPEEKGPDPKNVQRTFLALNVRPHSVVDPVVAPGYGFAILALDGRVLFHSEEGLSLEENFFEEVGDPQDVREKARSARLVRWMGDYHGRPHRFRMQPVQSFVNSPWLIVTFQELDPELAAEVLQQSGTLRLGTLNLLLLITVVLSVTGRAAFKHRRIRDLIQSVLVSKPAGPGLMWVLIGLLGIEVASLLATLFSPVHLWLDWVFLVFVIVPPIALLSTLYVRWWEPDDFERNRPELTPAVQRFVSFELLALALVIGALPAIGFARVVHIVHNTKSAERWLEVVNQRWSERAARVAERVNDPNYSEETRGLLRAGFAAARPPLDPGSDFAYVRFIDRVGALQLAPDASDSVPPETGQTWVRYLLEWNLSSSNDAPATTQVVRSSANHQLSLPRRPGDNVLAVSVASVSRGMAPFGVLLGLAILGGAMAAVYWARGRLLWPAGRTTATLKDVIYHPPLDGNGVVLLIGAPRTGKDEDVERAVTPIHRIRLLEGNLTEDTVKTYLQQVDDALFRKPPARGQRIYIHLSNLEAQLVDEESRRLVLRLIDRLLISDRSQPRTLVVTTNVDPIAHFQEVFSEERVGIYADDAPEVFLSRAALLLSRFKRCYVPIGPTLPTELDVQCRTAWDKWWRYEPADWPKALEIELASFMPLAALREELEAAFDRRDKVPLPELARVIRRRVNAYYELLWTSCTRKEKLVLIQLAQEGFVTSQSWDVVAPLVAKGLIVESPVLTIFNRTFREFVADIERSGVVADWERMEGNGLWQVSGRLIGASLLAGGLFFLLTQDFTMQSLLPVVSGTGMFGAPLFRTILARVSGKSAVTA